MKPENFQLGQSIRWTLVTRFTEMSSPFDGLEENMKSEHYQFDQSIR